MTPGLQGLDALQFSRLLLQHFSARRRPCTRLWRSPLDLLSFIRKPRLACFEPESFIPIQAQHMAKLNRFSDLICLHLDVPLSSDPPLREGNEDSWKNLYGVRRATFPLFFLQRSVHVCEFPRHTMTDIAQTRTRTRSTSPSIGLHTSLKNRFRSGCPPL